MKQHFKIVIVLSVLIILSSCETIGNNLFPDNPNSSSKSNSNNACASITFGDNKKLVCGDSKDRVLEKLGQPDSVSPTHSQWRYGLCVIEFIKGGLRNYGGKCDLEKISNDSFVGDRIELNDKKLYESKTFINTKGIKEKNLCLKVEEEDSFSTLLSLMGNPLVLERNSITQYDDICDGNIIKHSKDYESCSDNIATYGYYKTDNYGRKEFCKMYIRNKKIFFIDDNCPIECSLFD